MLKRIASFFLLAGLLAGCGAPQPDAGSRARALADAGATVVDVRTPAEYSAGHVGGAVNLPVDQVAERISEVTTNKADPLLVHCQSGRRSAIATERLRSKGYTNVVDLGSLQNAREVTGR